MLACIDFVLRVSLQILQISVRTELVDLRDQEGFVGYQGSKWPVFQSGEKGDSLAAKLTPVGAEHIFLGGAYEHEQTKFADPHRGR